MDSSMFGNEAARLQALHRYDILDTDAEPAYDDLVQLAAQICHVPIALISLIDGDRQWFKARIGTELTETPRDIAFCNYTIQSNEPLVVTDPQIDPRFAENPLVTGPLKIRFYAGAPLITPEGYRIGSICVIDQLPHSPCSEQVAALQRLSRQVISQMELRQSFAALRQSEEQLYRLVKHMPVMLNAFDIDGNITVWNDECERITGYSAEEMIGKPDALQRLYPNPVYLQQQLSSWERRGNSYRNWEWSLTCKDGSVRTIAWSNVADQFPIPGWRFWGVGIDVTEQKQAECALRQQTEREHLVADIANRIRQSLDLTEILNTTVAEVQRLLKADRVLTYRIDSQGEGMVTHEAVAAGYPRIQDQVLPKEIFPTECHELYRRGRVRAVMNVEQDDMSPCLVEMLRGMQVKAKLVVPILYKEELWGLLVVHQCSDVRQWQPWEAELLMQLATQVAIAIHQSELYQQVQCELAERIQAEYKIRDQAALLDVATDAIWVQDLDHYIRYWNRGAERLYGWLAEEVCHRPVEEFLYREPASTITQIRETTLRHGQWQGELRQWTKDGQEIVVESRWALVYDLAEQPKAILMVNTDITQKKSLEHQVLRTQRMESIGTLAGGIAHDLNNLLAPILMAVPLLEQQLCEQDGSKNCQWLNVVEQSARRGAGLVRQVLSFARGVEGERSPLELKHLVWEIQQIVEETFPKTLTLSTNVPYDLWAVCGDATQLHQILMNLCLNARDAMPCGGTLCLDACNLELTEDFTQFQLDAKVGPYVRITVSDTGMGIPKDILDRIFDPFFTTKTTGKGTGLGLSTVMTIVKSHGGFVTVSSQVDCGTTFQVYLPAIQDPAIASPARSILVSNCDAVVLIVDDEPLMREVTQASLEKYGCQVLTASNGIEAIQIFTRHQDKIQLVIVDMMMPLMGGTTTIQRLKDINPHIKIISTSGLEAPHLSLEPLTEISGSLLKPFTTEELLIALQQVLHTESECSRN
ncbi:GAF domain-containing protein [Leptolyngbya sp. AN02str]|uniref:GAF domain-containing protein n=1 Tax=Leptolyngbya sp. AN02str TaxID=3423363 RepID=UPI003D31C8CA